MASLLIPLEVLDGLHTDDRAFGPLVDLPHSRAPSSVANGPKYSGSLGALSASSTTQHSSLGQAVSRSWPPLAGIVGFQRHRLGHDMPILDVLAQAAEVLEADLSIERDHCHA